MLQNKLQVHKPFLVYRPPSLPLFVPPFLPPRHKILAKKMRTWSGGSSWLMPRLLWLLFLVLPGTSLLLAMLAICHLWLPVGLCVVALLVIFGFFWPFVPHRLPHDSGWPNPALFGALLSGLIHTAVCYFAVVIPHILLTGLLTKNK